MKTHTPDSPYDGSEEEENIELDELEATVAKYGPENLTEREEVELERIRAEQASKLHFPQAATSLKHGEFFDSKSFQREVVVEGSYTSFMKALALTLANIIMITVIIYALKFYFAVKEVSQDLNETINQW
jgi:hypothetical protein